MENFNVMNLFKDVHLYIEFYFIIFFGIFLFVLSHILNYNKRHVFYHNFFYLVILFIVSFSFFISGILNIKIFNNIEMTIFVRTVTILIAFALMFLSIKNCFEKYYIIDDTLVVIKNFKKIYIDIRDIYKINYSYGGDADGFFILFLTDNKKIEIGHSISNLYNLMEDLQKINPTIIYNIKPIKFFYKLLYLILSAGLNVFYFAVFVYFSLYVIAIFKILLLQSS